MSASITDFFKPTTGTSTRKRKLSTDELATTVVDDTNEPARKKKRLDSRNAEEDIKDKEEEDDDEEEDELTENKAPAKELTFANCDELMNKSWNSVLCAEFKKAYFCDLQRQLEKERKKGVEIFPPLPMVFRAFDLCEWDNLKAVILGQDPYHDDHQAEGLCFSVQKGVKIPSSLRNMMKEAVSDVEFELPGHGSLVQWAQQGVLLLNTVLTVQAHKANSHKKFGWQKFTDAVIKCISEKHDGVVFILWGKQAQAKKKLIDTSKHKVIESPHPSGLSAHRGFYNSKPYSKCNGFLQELGKDPINWQIDP